MKVKGIVEKISSNIIEGWVVVYNSDNEILKSPKVELKINEKTVAVTFAVRQTMHNSIDSSESGFRFIIKDLFNYLNEGDEITVYCYGENLPIYKHGLSYKCKTNGIYDTNELFKKLESGYVFDIKGELKLSLKENKELKKNVLSLYSEIKGIFSDEFTLYLYACYGTLLGIVRDNDFILNDGNFDCAYLSNKRKKDEVVEEFKFIAKELINKGYTLKIFNTHIQVNKGDPNIAINIYCSWINDESKLLFSFKYVDDELIIEENSFYTETFVLSGYDIIIPRKSKNVLKQIYGEKWSITDYGFDWDLVDRKVEFLTDNDINEIYWHQYYLNIDSQKPSTFCNLVNDFITKKYLILDIGCGSARDSFGFAERGHYVIGVDQSEQAIKFANSLKRKKGLKNIEFFVASVSDSEKMSELLKKTTNKAKQSQINIIYYSRFFLHTIDEETQKIFLKTISNYLQKGDLFVAEFRTKEDATRKKVYSNHYRRYVDENDVLKQLDEVCNMSNILLFQKGTGFSIYKDEDPFLARIIVKKD